MTVSVKPNRKCEASQHQKLFSSTFSQIVSKSVCHLHVFKSCEPKFRSNYFWCYFLLTMLLPFTSRGKKRFCFTTNLFRCWFFGIHLFQSFPVIFHTIFAYRILSSKFGNVSDVFDRVWQIKMQNTTITMEGKKCRAIVELERL